jgi:hypothetical protein
MLYKIIKQKVNYKELSKTFNKFYLHSYIFKSQY